MKPAIDGEERFWIRDDGTFYRMGVDWENLSGEDVEDCERMGIEPLPLWMSDANAVREIEAAFYYGYPSQRAAAIGVWGFDPDGLPRDMAEVRRDVVPKSVLDNL